MTGPLRNDRIVPFATQPADPLPVIASTRKSVGIQPLRAVKYLAVSLFDNRNAIARSRLGETTLRASFYHNAAAFVDSPLGRQLYVQDGHLSDWIDDPALWSDCGPETVAVHYRRFMESQNTTAKALKELSSTWRLEDGWHEDRVEWYISRAYSAHDIAHVLFGYGFDILGEMCLMASYSPHYPSVGISIQIKHGIRQIEKAEPYKGYTRAAVAEGFRIGTNVPAIWEQDIRKLMRMNLAEARAMLGIKPPVVYQHSR